MESVGREAISGPAAVAKGVAPFRPPGEVRGSWRFAPAPLKNWLTHRVRPRAIDPTGPTARRALLRVRAGGKPDGTRCTRQHQSGSERCAHFGCPPNAGDRAGAQSALVLRRCQVRGAGLGRLGLGGPGVRHRYQAAVCGSVPLRGWGVRPSGYPCTSLTGGAA